MPNQEQQDALQAKSADPSSQTLTGTLERITFFNPDNHYTVARLSVEGVPQPITIVGKLVGANIGDTLEVTGKFTSHPRYGRQLEVEYYRPKLPSSIKGLQNYLGSGLIKGIGKAYAKKLVDHFGMQLLDVLDKDPDRLREVRDFGPKRVEQVKKAWKEQQAVRDLMLYMQDNEIPLTHASRIYREYGDQAIFILRNNPYQLALDIRGIGFHTSDRMAARIGMDPKSPHRIDSGILHLLNKLLDEGHCYFPYEPLMDKAKQLLDIEDESLINQSLKRLHEDERIHLEKLSNDDRAVYLHNIWQYENQFSEHLAAMLRCGKLIPSMDVSKELAEFEKRYKFELADQQRRAVELALQGGMLIVTGGPGTGKTTLLRGIIDILKRKGVGIHLTAPTGRAAKRLSEASHQPASTIHRLLKYNPHKGGFEHNARNPLKAQLLIVDEASMLDLPLANVLLQALAPETSVLFVGDVDQLPSVGPGNILGDMIASREVPVVRLNVVFRQASRSRIVVNAHRINEGKLPLFDNDGGPDKVDFFFTQKAEPAEVSRIIVQLVKDRIPFKFGFRPIEDIQVITPMHRGILGTQELNRELQAALNPNRTPLYRGGRAFCVGDKVMQVSNNYEKDVFNGDIGSISAIDEEEQVVWVNYYGRRVAYDYTELDEIQLSYAITVHKSQGSEYPAVVIPIHTQHYVFLQRNLLYTAVTRGKRLVCLVGTKKAMAMAVKNDKTSRRFTSIALRLQNLLHG